MKNILLTLCLLAAAGAQLKAQHASSRPPVVILGFDDAELTALTTVAPLLQKYHFNATFFVCEMHWTAAADSGYYLNWPQIATLHQMGFEIGNHTGHHKNMTKMTVEQMQAEVGYIEEKCKAYGIPKPVSFAYPGNRDDSTAQVVLRQMGYRYARTGHSRYFDPAKDSLLAIPSFTMGSTDKLGARTWQALEELQPGQILVFTIHGVPDPAHPGYTTSAAVLESYLKFMQERHCKVIAMRDLAQYLVP